LKHEVALTFMETYHISLSLKNYKLVKKEKAKENTLVLVT